ncbi:TPA: hypothetical protein ACHXA8_004603, partial [Escherichia coli]
NHRPQRRGRICESTSRTDKRIHDNGGGKFCHADRVGASEAEQVTTINVKTGEKAMYGKKLHKNEGLITIHEITATGHGWWVETEEGLSPVAAWALCVISYPESNEPHQNILPVISTSKGMKPVDISRNGFKCVMMTENMMEEMSKNNCGKLH